MSSQPTPLADRNGILGLVGKIVAAYVSNNPVPVSELPSTIQSIHSTLANLSGSFSLGAATSKEPAVPVKKSITPDYLICLEDGKKLKMLKRYLRSRYGLSPDQYRAKWELPNGYPMVAANYSERRSDLAKKSGLGLTANSKRRRRS